MANLQKSNWLSNLIGLVGFLGVPSLVTLVAPVTYLTLQSVDGKTQAVVQKCMLLVVPYSTQHMADLQKVETRLIKGRRYTSEERRRGHRGRIVDDGHLDLKGDGAEISIPLAPDRLQETQERIQAFREARPTAPLQLRLPANWWVSYLVGGTLTFFFLLYLVGLCLLPFQWIYQAWRRAAIPAASR